MAEAAGQLDLQVLINDDLDVSRLVPTHKKLPFKKRRTTQIFVLVISIGILSTLVRWLRQDFSPPYYPPSLIIIILILALRRDQVDGIYIISQRGIQIPYTWLFRRTIPFENVIRVVDDKITSEQSDKEFAAIRIIVDSDLIKLNITGMQSPNILLSTRSYDSMDLNRFADEVMKKKREVNANINTLAQRLTDQVNRAWGNRWKLIFLNTGDSTSEVLFFLLIVDSFVFGLFGVSIWPLLGIILVGLYLVMVFIIQFFQKPQAIIGIRPHELGPLLYDEEELITSVRFIIICKPYTVNLRDCEIIYPENATRQVGRLNQIQPSEVPPGELIYGIAQFVGNHSKASGAKIQFTYKETEDQRDVIYEVLIEWA